MQEIVYPDYTLKVLAQWKELALFPEGDGFKSPRGQW